MKRSIIGTALALSLFLAPVAHADTAPVPIGNPYTDTIQLWGEVASVLTSLAHDFASLLNGREVAASGGQQPPASLAAAAASSISSTSSATSSEPAPNATTDQTTLSQNVKPAEFDSAQSSSRNSTNVIEAEPAFNARDFVTQSELAQALLALSNSLATKSAPTTTSILPEWVAADGNPSVPYAAESNIGTLSGVTISNANLSASEIPALDYLSLSGGTLAGDLSVSGNATTSGNAYVAGNLGIGTSTSQDALAVNGSEYLPDITAPTLTTNRLYANGGSLYWAGSVIAGGATGNWTSDGTNVWRSGGDIGVGTTSPFATISVVGTGYFTGALTAAAINATNGTTSNATSTSLFSTFGNFTTGLINTLSGTTLNYSAASTTNLSNFGTAYFGGSATSSFNSAGVLSLAAPLALTSGGTGQTSFGQGWITSNGSTLSASTSPTINYVTATSTTATSTFAGNLSVSGLSGFGGLQLSGNKTYSGASGDANSFMFMPGAALFGTASGAPNGITSPFNLYISGDQVNTTSSGNGNLIDFSVDGAVGNGHTGGREAFQSYLNIVGTPSTTPGTAGYVGGQFMLRGSANLTGTGGSYSNYHGGAFASNADVFLTSGATFYGLVNAEEFDVTVPTGASTANKYGISIVKGSNDAVRGAYDDSALSIDDQDNASDPGWHYGISFGSYSAQWAFATDSTLIMGQQRQIGPSSPSVALNGVDFRNVTFGGYAFASLGFTVDGSGNIVGDDLYASSTPFVTFVGHGAGAGVIASATSSNQTSGEYATALGYQALANATSSAYESVAVGYDALLSSATISSANASNTAIGFEALKSNASGATNVAVGNVALWANTSGNNNTAIGATSMQFNTTGFSNTAMGRQALDENTSGTSNTGIGVLALLNTQTGSNNTAVGLGAGEGVSNDSFANNSLFGTNAGFALSSGGNNNLFIGKDAASTTASGANNIALGYAIDLPVVNGSNQLDIGNLVFGTGLSSTYAAAPAGDIGIGTTTPSSRLTVWGADSASSTPALNVVNNASTTVFSVFDGGNAELSGSLSQSSDQRLKTNIQSLDASSSLSFIDELNPVIFNWIDPNQTTALQLGFIAQQVQQIFPNLVSTTSATALTPGGTLSLNYIGLISPIVSAIQALDQELSNLAATVAGFAQAFTTHILTGDDVTANNELCVGSTCVTPAQFQAMVAAASAPQSSGQGSGQAPLDDAEATNTPPVIQINGDNPAIIQVGATYNDLGAIITGPTADLNLGITTYVNDAAMNPVQIDTSAAATDTIDYVAIDQNGLTSTSTRTVIIEAPSIAPSDDASSTDATTTAQ